METKQKIAITGAYSYSGKYITQRLLAQGHEVITLTGSPDRPDPFNGQVKAYPFDFKDLAGLVETFEGVDTFINTYWVRFDYGKSSFFQAVSNTRAMFWAARKAGVRRIVHVSITNPDNHSRLPYFWGKAILEEDLKSLGLSYAILRPTVIFGKEDILINNITWFLRRFPAFAIPGSGEYRLQPIYVEDLAQLAAAQAVADENTIIDAIGPETYTFTQLVTMLRDTVGARSLLVHTPPNLARWLSSIVGWWVKDVVLTKDEVVGLLEDRLVTDSPPAGSTKLSEWVAQHADTLGQHYAHEINRHYQQA